MNLGAGTLFRNRMVSASVGIVKLGWFGVSCLIASRGCVFCFLRASKILLGKVVWSSLRWLPAACSMCVWNLSAIP